jgi:hypothetical protein
MTMAALTIVDQRRELAHRIAGGLEVTLYWHQGDNRTSIQVHHLASGTTLRSEVPGEDALDAFYHPLAHIKYSIAA